MCTLQPQGKGADFLSVGRDVSFTLVCNDCNTRKEENLAKSIGPFEEDC